MYEIQEFANKNNISLDLIDNSVSLKQIRFPKCQLELAKEQKKVVKKLLQNEQAILEAKPGFGKTIVALYCIAKRKQPTLIIVHRKSLLTQWQKEVTKFLNIDIKEIGVIGEGKVKVGKHITVAMYQTLARKGIQDIKNNFGFVVVDECHHTPANTFMKVIKELPAKYVLGLTATSVRQDKLERLMTFYIGQIVSAKGDKSQVQENEDTVTTHVKIRPTKFEIETKGTEFNELTNGIIHGQERNIQIATDVVDILQRGCKCIVLTERIEHCNILNKLIKEKIKQKRIAVVNGQLTKKKRQRFLDRIKKNYYDLVIATGKLLGEGFDWPEVSYLFLAFPLSWKGKLIQYLGRIQRQSEGKQEASVYDYVDYNVPMLKIMYFKRLRTYRVLGLIKEENRKKPKVVSDNQLSLF